MNITQYINSLLVIFWNIIAFLCPCISKDNFEEDKTRSLSVCVNVYNYSSSIYTILKEFSNKLLLKHNNKNSINITIEPKDTYRNKNAVINRINFDNTLINQAIKFAKSLYSNRLKDAQATQILILKRHFIRLEDKCAHFSLFAVQKCHCLIFIVLI